MSNLSSAQRIKDIFLQALDAPNEESRLDLLNEACRGDSEIRRQIERMLANHFSPNGFMSGPAVSDPIAESKIFEEAETLGPYHLLEKLGEGGCGVVYLAEQKDPVRRKVALKVIKAGMDTKTVIARFEAERQALAMMNHPNVARVFDAGTTQLGRPYFAMELVEGPPITTYCDQKKYSTEQRLQLFVQVCEAVQHAHQKGIIHRDLKPSNVLVSDRNGSVSTKIIDFGIAKAMGASLTEHTLVTAVEHFIGTPAYMSPEQALLTSEDIDTRTDIYSLGVLLYELLTGKAPFDHHELLSAGIDEMRRIIREKEPDPPSTRLVKELRKDDQKESPSGLLSNQDQTREISPDLDWIVMKSLEKERTRRYETVEALASDVQRYLNNEPVLARPTSRYYRFQKFVQRNRVYCFAGTSITIVFLGAVIISTWQAVLARKSERRAKAITEFLVTELLKTNPFSESQAAEGKKAFAEGVAKALDGRFIDDPLVEAELRMTLWAALIGQKAIDQCERALKIRTRLLGPDHSDTLSTAARLSWVYSDVGRNSDAERTLVNALVHVRRGHKRSSQGEGETLFAKGVLLRKNKRPGEALPWMEEGLMIISRTAVPNDWRYIQQMGEYAMTAVAAGKTELAEKQWQNLISHCERHLGRDNPMTAQAVKGQAYGWIEQGRWREARQNLEGALPIFREISSDNFALLDCEDLLARTYELEGNISKAVEIYLSTYPRWAAYFPHNAAVGHCQSIAQFFKSNSLFKEATQVLKVVQDWYESKPPQAAWELELFITAAGASKGWTAASQLLERHITDFPESWWLWLNKAWLFRYTGNDRAYEQVVRHILKLPSHSISLDDSHLPIEIIALGRVPLSKEELTRMESMVNSVLHGQPQRPLHQQAWAYRTIAHYRLQQRRWKEALDAVDLAESRQTEPDCYTLCLKATCLHYLGENDQARRLLEQAITVGKSTLHTVSSNTDRFLNPSQLYQHLLMCRETAALLGHSQPASAR